VMLGKAAPVGGAIAAHLFTLLMLPSRDDTLGSLGRRD